MIAKFRYRLVLIFIILYATIDKFSSCDQYIFIVLLVLFSWKTRNFWKIESKDKYITGVCIWMSFCESHQTKNGRDLKDDDTFVT